MYSNIYIGSYSGGGGVDTLQPPTAYGDPQQKYRRQSQPQYQRNYQRYRSHSTECETRNPYENLNPPPPPQYSKVVMAKPAKHHNNQDTGANRNSQDNVGSKVEPNISRQGSSTYQANHYPQTSQQYSAYRKMMKQKQSTSGYETS